MNANPLVTCPVTLSKREVGWAIAANRRQHSRVDPV